jgi:hypothetical protein
VDWLNNYAGGWIADAYDLATGKRDGRRSVASVPRWMPWWVGCCGTSAPRGVGGGGGLCLGGEPGAQQRRSAFASDWAALWAGPSAWGRWTSSREASGLGLLSRDMMNEGRGLQDTLSFGITRSLREQWGWWMATGDNTDYDSDAYFLGGVAGTAVQVAIDVALMFVPARGGGGGEGGCDAGAGGGSAGSWALRLARRRGRGCVRRGLWGGPARVQLGGARARGEPGGGLGGACGVGVPGLPGRAIRDLQRWSTMTCWARAWRR